jgi:agmatine deiminase
MKMPAEWERHEATWVAFPHNGYTLGETQDEVEAAKRTWAKVANTASEYEHVRVVVHPNDASKASKYLSSQIEIVEFEIDDAWIRDSGPTFALDGTELVAVDWIFNGWGAQEWASYDQDAKLASRIAEYLGVKISPSELTNEGGGIHVNGSGLVLLTETVQLDKGRNSGWTRDRVEAELNRQLGTTEAIWLSRGLTRDYEEFGTKGHVDIVACFAPTGEVLVHDQQDAYHPDFTISREVIETLEGAGQSVIRIPAPRALKDGHGWVDYSYINHYVLNDAVLLCAFDDPNDQRVADQLAEIYPGRKIELIDARELFARGGGIHCITQQQPAIAAK